MTVQHICCLIACNACCSCQALPGSVWMHVTSLKLASVILKIIMVIPSFYMDCPYLCANAPFWSWLCIFLLSSCERSWSWTVNINVLMRLVRVYSTFFFYSTEYAESYEQTFQFSDMCVCVHASGQPDSWKQQKKGTKLSSRKRRHTCALTAICALVQASGRVRLGDLIEAVDGVVLTGDRASEAKYKDAVIGEPGTCLQIKLVDPLTVRSCHGVIMLIVPPPICWFWIKCTDPFAVGSSSFCRILLTATSICYLFRSAVCLQAKPADSFTVSTNFSLQHLLCLSKSLPLLKPSSFVPFVLGCALCQMPLKNQPSSFWAFLDVRSTVVLLTPCAVLDLW